MKEYSVINSRLPKVDAKAKSTGDAIYTDDITMSNMLYGALLQSPLAHAKIKSIDISKAKKLPGVKDIITAKEAGPVKFGGHGVGIGLVKYGVSPARYDETVLCEDKVRYVGDNVAAVAAVDLETALEAVSLIKVDYEELPVILDPFEAMKKGMIAIHDDYPNNICAEVHQEFGNFEEAIKTCDYVRTDKFVNKKQDGAFIEPQSCIAVYDLNGNLSLISSTQSSITFRGPLRWF